jgi:hypothetical protein
MSYIRVLNFIIKTRYDGYQTSAGKRLSPNLATDEQSTGVKKGKAGSKGTY